MITKIPGLIYEFSKIGYGVVKRVLRRPFTTTPACNETFYMRGYGDKHVWYCQLDVGHQGEHEIPRCEKEVIDRDCGGDRLRYCMSALHHPGDCI